MWLIALNVLSVLASLFPWDLGPQADASSRRRWESIPSGIS